MAMSTVINLQVVNEMTKMLPNKGGSHYPKYSNMYFQGNTSFGGSIEVVSADLQPVSSIKKIDYKGHRATWKITPDPATDFANVLLLFKSDPLLGKDGTMTMEVLTDPASERTKSNVTVTRTWTETKYGCQQRGPANAKTWIITLCEEADEREMCKSDGTCAEWPTPEGKTKEGKTNVAFSATNRPLNATQNSLVEQFHKNVMLGGNGSNNLCLDYDLCSCTIRNNCWFAANPQRPVQCCC
jgi:hypothetical protein